MLRARVYPTLWHTALVDRHGAGVQQQPQQQPLGPATIAAICKSTIRGLGFSSSAARLGRSGGAVDIIVVEHKDGSLKSTPWYVQFAKFQGVLRQNARSVAVSVNDADAGFQLYLNRWGTPYLLTDGKSCSGSGGPEGDGTAQTPGETQVLARKWYSRRWYGQGRLQSPIPSSDQLAALGLKEGRNKVSFTVTTPLLGKKQIDASIFLMRWDAKLIISDVDGTITKSDVLGQFMPLVGRDWSQTGVARLFSALKNNGYKLVFMSARAITQADQTRRFLANLMQDGDKLPDGPVMLSPEGIFPSLYREVIRRTPQEFKIPCLQQIREAFPSDYNPFYAGFGNRTTDVDSYLQVGVPPDRIYTINPRGEVLAHNVVDVTCYTSLHKLVNEVFPPLPRSASEAGDDCARC